MKPQGANSRKSGLLETHSRSLVKAISWRAAGTVDTIVVSCLITGRIKTALSIGLVELCTKMCLYYLHERAWNRIPFGKVPPHKDYEI
jgi:uncharacterized membrane protein